MAEMEFVPGSGFEPFRRIVADQVRFALGVRLVNPHNWEILAKEFDFGNRVGLAFNMFLLGCQIREDVKSREVVPTGLWSYALVKWPWLQRIFGVPRLREIPTVIQHWHVCPHLEARPDGTDHVVFLCGGHHGGGVPL